MSGLSKSMHTDIGEVDKGVNNYTAASHSGVQPFSRLGRPHSQAAPSQATPLSHTPRLLLPRFAFTGCVQKVEAQINDLQRGHDTRFADLHKDLAGIVWELSKLRATTWRGGRRWRS